MQRGAGRGVGGGGDGDAQRAQALDLRSVSRLRRAPVMVDGPDASAARISARLVIDFDPGSVTDASTGASARGALHRLSRLTGPSSLMTNVSVIRASMEACAAGMRRRRPRDARGGTRRRERDGGDRFRDRGLQRRAHDPGADGRRAARPGDDDSPVRRRIRRMRWGLVPSYATEPGKGAPLFNARSETVATKAAFKTSLRFSGASCRWTAGTSGRPSRPRTARP